MNQSDPYKIQDKVAVITGASRGIGAAIAKSFAKRGAKTVILAKTETETPELKGTIYSVAEAIEKAGGVALPIQCDVRSGEMIDDAILKVISEFGQIDYLVNNASAIYPNDTCNLTLKQFDVMQSVCVRGSFAMIKACYPYLKQSYNPHIVNISPPMTLYPEFFQKHCAYTIAKYAVSGMTLGMAYEFYADGVAVNSLWPRALIDTAAIKKFEQYDIRKENLRRPEIMGEAVCAIVTKPARACTGSFLIDDLVLMSEGVVNFREFAVSSGKDLIQDLFLPDDLPPPPPDAIFKPLIPRIIR